MAGGIVPYRIVKDFERAIADYAGARYAVAVESCTAALFLSLKYLDLVGQEVTIPKRTYPGVACSIIHAGGRVKFSDEPWQGIYELAPYGVWDGALRFRRWMYAGGLHCLSFHAKKLLPIGRGGMILCDDADAAHWLRVARFDGREEVDLGVQKEFKVLGWNMYMQPEQAARGLLLFASAKYKDLPDLVVEDQGYPDLSKSEIYSRGAVCSSR
jgi:dTDP-4-amino-4,6-dideoxygalactose transaminase